MFLWLESDFLGGKSFFFVPEIGKIVATNLEANDLNSVCHFAFHILSAKTSRMIKFPSVSS